MVVPAWQAEEFIVCCPGCLTLETLWFKGKTMQPTRKFEQKEGGLVYHDCGLTDRPCRLYLRFGKGS